MNTDLESVFGSNFQKVCDFLKMLLNWYKDMKKGDELCQKNLERLRDLHELLNRVKENSSPLVVNAIKHTVERFIEYEKKILGTWSENSVKKIISTKDEMLKMESLLSNCFDELNFALHADANESRIRERNKQDFKEKIAYQLNPLSSTIKSELEPPLELNTPEYLKNGGVILSWQNDNELEITGYQLEITQEVASSGKGYKDITEGSRKYYADPFVFLPQETYSVRIRAIKPTSSNWSKSIIVHVRSAPPNKPKCPELETYYCLTTGSSDGPVDCIRFRVPYPSEKDCNGKPLEKLVVYWSDENSTTFSSFERSVGTPNTDGYIVETIEEFNLDVPCIFKVAWENECGESEHSDSLKIHKNDAVPGPPTSIEHEVTDGVIKIKWDKPVVNAFAVSHYEVQKVNKSGIFKTSSTCTSDCTLVKISEQKTHIFRICSVTNNGMKSPFTEEVPIKTEASTNVVIGFVIVVFIITGFILSKAAFSSTLTKRINIFAFTTAILSVAGIQNKKAEGFIMLLVNLLISVMSAVGMVNTVPGFLIGKTSAAIVVAMLTGGMVVQGWIPTIAVMDKSRKIKLAMKKRMNSVFVITAVFVKTACIVAHVVINLAIAAELFVQQLQLNI